MNSTKLRIKYGQVEFEIESDAETVAKEREKFLETLPGLFSISSNVVNPLPADTVECLEKDESKLITYKNRNISSFINEKGLTSNNDICLGFAYFLQEVEDLEYIDSNLLKERIQKAKFSIPKNISLSINQLTQKGLLQPYDNKDSALASYYVTPDGIKYIEEFEKKEKKSSKSSKKSISAPTESRYSSLTKGKMNIDSYPSIPDLKSTKDKIMLLMYIIKDTNQGEYFTVNDIMYIMSKVLNERATIDMVQGLFKNKATKMLFDKQNVEGSKKLQEYKLLNSGEKYVKENILKSS